MAAGRPRSTRYQFVIKLRGDTLAGQGGTFGLGEGGTLGLGEGGTPGLGEGGSLMWTLHKWTLHKWTLHKRTLTGGPFERPP